MNNNNTNRLEQVTSGLHVIYSAFSCQLLLSIFLSLSGRDVQDGINLLVATDVAQEGLDMPKCSFVVRYNFVSNEIGSVQSKGRARAQNSECYLIVNRESINEKKEYENLEKEHMMMQALDDIEEMSCDELRRKIKDEQVRKVLVHSFVVLFMLHATLVLQ